MTLCWNSLSLSMPPTYHQPREGIPSRVLTKGRKQKGISNKSVRNFTYGSQETTSTWIKDSINLKFYGIPETCLYFTGTSFQQILRYYFQKYLYSTFVKSVQELMEAEQKLIKQQKHILYTILRTISAREACLRQSKKHLAQLRAQDVYEYLHIARQRFFNDKKKNQHQKFLKKGYRLKSNVDNQPSQQAKMSKCKLQFFSDNFNHLTKLTLYCIDQIFRWKEYIASLTHDAKKKRQRVQYYYFEDNYFLKILSDTSFIKVSFLERFYKFAPKNDPFMLWPVLAFQKSEVKQLDNQLLKHIFMPQEDQLSEIMNKVEALSEEYKYNIRSRKTYDVNVLRKPSQIQNQRRQLDSQLQKQPVANLVLKRLQNSPPKRSQSLKAFRIRQETKQKRIITTTSKDKIFIQFKTSPKKRSNWLPVGSLKTVLQTQTSPLKHSVILQRNKENPLSESQITDDLLKSLKQQVVRKIKLDFAANTPSNSSSNDEALQMYIKTKINQAIKGIFPYQPQKQLKPSIQLTSFRIQEGKISSQISLMFKHMIQKYKELQYIESDLMKKIQQAPYVYFLKATMGEEYLGTVILTLDTQIQEYKAIKTLYVGFNEVSQLQMLMLQTTRFIQKYENAFEMHFPFFQPSNNQAINLLLTSLQQALTKPNQKKQCPCIVVQKQIYSNVSEVRYIFKRQNKNTNYYPNRYPVSLNFKLALIHSKSKLFLERSKIDKSYPTRICYDFLLSQILRKVYDSQTLNILKEKSLTQQRFKEIINHMIDLQKDSSRILGQKNQMRFIQSENISEMNRQLSKRKDEYPFFELTDTTKTGNQVHSVSLAFVLRLPYQTIKSIVGKNNQMYYKISIRQQIQIKTYKETIFYKIPLQSKQTDRSGNNQPLPMSKFLVLFDAQDYHKQKHPQLSTYLIQALVRSPQIQSEKSTILINQLWLPMVRYPEKYLEREELYMSTHRLNDLQELKQELFVGQFFEWFCDMQLQNGIKYHSFDEQRTVGQIVLKKALGLAVIAQDASKSIILYGRVFNNK